MLAVLYGENDIVEQLLRYPGIDDTLKDRLGRTAFFFAKYLNRHGIVEQLLQHPQFIAMRETSLREMRIMHSV